MVTVAKSKKKTTHLLSPNPTCIMLLSPVIYVTDSMVRKLLQMKKICVVLIDLCLSETCSEQFSEIFLIEGNGLIN